MADATTKRTRPEPVARGTLSKSPLGHVIAYGFDKRLSGSIQLWAPDGRTGELVLTEGFVGKARTSDADGFLGRVLLRLGLINNATLDHHLARDGTLDGDALVAAGDLSDANLDIAVRAQLLERVIALFAFPSETRYVFFKDWNVLHDFEGHFFKTLHPFQALWAGTKEHAPWEHVKGTVGRVKYAHLRAVPGVRLENFEVDVPLRHALERMANRATSMAEIVQSLPSPDLVKTAELLIYCLLITKQIEVVDAASHPANAGATSAIRPPAAAAANSAARSADAWPTQAPGALGMTPGTAFPPAGSVSPSPRDRSTPDEDALAAVRAAAAAPPKIKYPAPANQDRQGDARGHLDDAIPLMTPGEMHIGASSGGSGSGGAKSASSRRGGIELELDLRPSGARVDTSLLPPTVGGSVAPGAKAPAPFPVPALTVDASAGALSEPMAHYDRAQRALRTGDLPAAEAWTKKALALEGGNSAFLALAAWIESVKPDCQSSRTADEARAAIDRAIQINDRSADAFYYRGLVYRRMKDYHKAMRDFHHAVELNPRHGGAMAEIRKYQEQRRPRV